MAEKKSLVPKENNPRLRAEVERIKKKEAKKLPAILDFIKNNSITKSAEKYPGSVLFKAFGMLQNRKKQLGTTAFNALRKKIAKAKGMRKNRIEKGQASDRLDENINTSLQKKGGKVVKKMQSGGRVGPPRGTGAALRGFGKGYK
tara:strand:- start:588 stop:1022 length:435 start_codon:yes stop_codon:yes gene_type:complete